MEQLFLHLPRTPYGAMCQGEGTSLLIRAYKHSGNKIYLEAAQKALDFMLISVTNGGTSDETEERLLLLEYTHRTAVLNGWIFALFGLYDAALVCDSRVYRDAFDKSLHSLSNHFMILIADIGQFIAETEKLQVRFTMICTLHRCKPFTL